MPNKVTLNETITTGDPPDSINPEMIMTIIKMSSAEGVKTGLKIQYMKLLMSPGHLHPEMTRHPSSLVLESILG